MIVGQELEVEGMRGNTTARKWPRSDVQSAKEGGSMKNDLIKRLERIEGSNKSNAQNVTHSLQAVVDGTRKDNKPIDPVLQRIIADYYAEQDKTIGAEGFTARC